MLEVRDERPARGVPWVVLALAGANVLAFLSALWGTAGPESDARALELFETWGLVPRKILRGGDPALWLTPLTSMFLHVDVLHLLGNLACLALFGTRLEELLGSWRFLLLYAVCGAVAAAAQVASAPTSWDAHVGASGAVSGVIGAYALAYPLGQLRLEWPRVELPALGFLALWIAIQLQHGGADGTVGGVAGWAHVGGFTAGIALAWVMWVMKPTRSDLRI